MNCSPLRSQSLLLCFAWFTLCVPAFAAPTDHWDELRLAAQKICPVSGQPLGSKGEPLKVKVGEQIAFLCCKECQGQPIDAGHWKTVQANLAAAQGTCPIMGKPVTAEMKSTVVEGQVIFVCCPPCIAKIQNDPAPALAKVRAAYTRVATAQAQANSDQWQIKAQKICPVSGDKLGSRGEPVKVKVGEEVAFLCCQSCTGDKISAKLWAQVQTNLAAAQGICPIMKKPVDATMKSTTINGRKIFVCCPPCIPKIQAEPGKYVAVLNTLIEQNLAQDR